MSVLIHRARLGVLAALLFTTAAATAAQDPTAQGVLREGDLTIRYNAVAASALPAASAQSLGLSRAPGQGLLNVVVTRGTGVDAPTVAADVSAHALTGGGASVAIKVRTIRDENGVSYLGVFQVPASDTLHFDVDVTPQGGTTQHIHFEHTFIVG